MPVFALFNGTPSHSGLKDEYLDCLARLSNDSPTLRNIVKQLLASGTDWRELISWAVDAGHRDKYVRQLLSQILRDLGIRRRKTGAGRETPQEALLLLAHTESLYGEKAESLLLGAYRASRRRKAVQLDAGHNHETLVIL